MSRSDAENGNTTMQLCRARGNTWYLADWQLIPLYRVDETHCILLDTGLLGQREGIEQALLQNGLTPIGILGTHIHTDHSPNHRYFQQKYHIPVALPAGEAGLCLSPLTLKAYLFMLSPHQVEEEFDVIAMQLAVDQMVMPNDTEFTFCGVTFGIVHTPGHSPDHISIRTPDDVLYLGDAMLTGTEISQAKLPYFFAHEAAIATLERLREERATLYLAAHRGVYTDISDIIEENIAVIRDRAAQVLAQIDRPMTLSEIQSVVCRHFGLLSSNPSRASLYERNVRIYVEYLRDTGALTVSSRGGVLCYAAADPLSPSMPPAPGGVFSHLSRKGATR